MLSNRMIHILKVLIATKVPITSDDLANRIQVTSRTIRNDIKELNEILLISGGVIKSTRGIGYELEIKDQKKFKLFLQEMTNDSHATNQTPNTPEERVHHIVRKLLLENGYIKLDDLADDLYISKSTLQHDLIEVRRILNTFKLELESKPYHGVKVIGNEMNLRFCLSEYLFNRKELMMYKEYQMDFILPEEDMKRIQSILIEEIKHTDIEMSDVALHNLSIHFAIACKRIHDGNYVLLAPDEFEGICHTTEYEVAKQIVSKIESAFHVSFPETEIAYIAIHLLGTKKIASRNLNRQEFESFVERDLRDTIQEIIQKIDDRFHLQLKNDNELYISLSLHLKPAINRLQFGMNMRNPMLEEIKAKYPLAFEAGILAGKVLEERLAVHIDEDEIGYIALHISVAMERQKMNQDVKRCMIVCATGTGSAMLLKYKLQAKYFHQLIVVDTIEYYRLNETPLKNIDFIITTIPIEEEVPVPVVYVRTILGSDDFMKIEQYLHDRNENKITYLKEDLIFLQEDLGTQEKVIKFLVHELEDAGYVTSDFGASVIEREKLSPTSFGNLVAMPHPMESFTEETFWTICTLKRPIEWSGNRVQFVCLLSIGKHDTNLQGMYEYLISIIENEQIVKQLISCKDKKEFIETLNRSYDR
ncbi:BglG family transcription antiterminator [Ornithinibacillus halotolerans]|uniref:LicABCH operon regulator n=1 Tax=Ornithinibacillus halotolerans TaxID=1274357 RepID=A0A916WF83_9BACI|nr:BglG family transcription antiterminator [Ornithinibacillus halotolerans]GGA92101.1 putative licABCH operon regulator [Ornithinibacillus halotolerans]